MDINKTTFSKLVKLNKCTLEYSIYPCKSSNVNKHLICNDSYIVVIVVSYKSIINALIMLLLSLMSY